LRAKHQATPLKTMPQPTEEKLCWARTAERMFTGRKPGGD
jgi:hypothetical protein